MATSSAHIEFAPGTQIGGYRLKGMLGRGGMGTVYLAEQISIQREVALKVLPIKGFANQPKRLEKFVTEAKVAAKLSHPCLVTVHEVGKDAEQGVYFYSMECVKGRTLRTVVQQEGRLKTDFVRDLAIQVAGALGHGHRQGLVHRDVKPENIIVDQQGLAKLADLGLATAEARGLEQRGSRVLAIVGTPGWSAPEQLRNPGSVVPASDVFALGCVISYCLTGLEPFTGDTLIDMAVRVCTEDVAGFEDLMPPMRDVIAAFTAKEPEDRPADGNAAIAVLDGHVDPATQPGSGRIRPRRRARRRR